MSKILASLLAVAVAALALVLVLLPGDKDPGTAEIVALEDAEAPKSQGVVSTSSSTEAPTISVGVEAGTRTDLDENKDTTATTTTEPTTTTTLDPGPVTLWDLRLTNVSTSRLDPSQDAGLVHPTGELITGEMISDAIRWGYKRSTVIGGLRSGCKWDDDPMLMEFALGTDYTSFSVLFGVTSDSKPEAQVHYRILVDGDLVAERTADRLNPTTAEIDVAGAAFLTITWIIGDCGGEAWSIIADPYLQRA